MASHSSRCPIQPAGDLWIDQDIGGEVADYRRVPRPRNGHRCDDFRRRRATFTREVFASPVDGVIVVRLDRATGRAASSFMLSLTSEQPVRSVAVDGQHDRLARQATATAKASPAG